MRAISRALNSKLIKTAPREAYDDIGRALGIMRDGVLFFDSEDETSVMMDCLLYDWRRDGKNLVQLYAEAHPAEPGSDESFLLQAMVRARYGVLLLESVIPNAGVYCRDTLNAEELFVMDLGLSRNASVEGGAIATRTLPLGEYWMTGGAGLPVSSKMDIEGAFLQIVREHPTIQHGQSAVPLAIVRACLAAGVAEHLRYETESSLKKPQRQSNLPPRKRRWR